MRILIVGAGAIGGYVGGRLLAAGRDVTFLVRPRRAALLAERGLEIRSSRGDLHLTAPPTVTADRLTGPYDLIVLSCKAFDLDAAIDDIAPAVGPNTGILPLLNGMAHLDRLTARFGAAYVLGGQCVMATTLDPDGRILHLNDVHDLSYGERDGSRSSRVLALEEDFRGTNIDARLSTAIMQEMWDKWIFIATGMGINSLMRAPIGDIVAAGGAELALRLLEECEAIVGKVGLPPTEAARTRNRALFTAAGSPLTTSMLRDIERGARIEADHVIGDMVRRGRDAGLQSPLLRVVYAHVLTYEARRKRLAEQGH